MLAILGANKQLDLQSSLTSVARELAHQQGWYEQRREVQVRFIASLIAFSTLGAALMTFKLRKADPATLVAVLGAVALLCFIVVRAASFHQVDLWVTTPIAGLEAGGGSSLRESS